MAREAVMAADNSRTKANTRTQSSNWKALVEEYEDLTEDHVAYEFSRKVFKENDNSGVYGE
jgi:hypothetical protein